MKELWEICPDCGIGKNQDHKKGCPRSKPLSVATHGRGITGEMIGQGPNLAGPDVARRRQSINAAEAEFLTTRGVPEDVATRAAAIVRRGVARYRGYTADQALELIAQEIEGLRD